MFLAVFGPMILRRTIQGVCFKNLQLSSFQKKWFMFNEDEQTSGWWFQPIWNIYSSNWIISPTNRDENNKIFETTNQNINWRNSSLLYWGSLNPWTAWTCLSFSPLWGGGGGTPTAFFVIRCALLTAPPTNSILVILQNHRRFHKPKYSRYWYIYLHLPKKNNQM